MRPMENRAVVVFRELGPAEAGSTETAVNEGPRLKNRRVTKDLPATKSRCRLYDDKLRLRRFARAKNYRSVRSIQNRRPGSEPKEYRFGRHPRRGRASRCQHHTRPFRRRDQRRKNPRSFSSEINSSNASRNCAFIAISKPRPGPSIKSKTPSSRPSR